MTTLPCGWIFWPCCLWVIRFKKKTQSFAYVVCRDNVNRAQNSDHAVRTCKRFVYPIVKIVRFMADTVFEKFTRCTKICGLFFFLIVPFGDDWLGRQTPITWQLRVHGLVYLGGVSFRRMHILAVRSFQSGCCTFLSSQFCENYWPLGLLSFPERRNLLEFGSWFCPRDCV